jgi:hypothetical protein
MADRVLTSRSVEDFFHDALQSALGNQQIEASADTVRYVVNVLSAFSRTDRLYQHTGDGYGLKPLALLYADAVYSTNTTERNYALRRLGDVALFIAGLFSHSLNRKLVDVDYYVAMGGSAYGQLSSNVLASRTGTAMSPVFAELSRKFTDFVDALAEIGEDANFNNDSDLLRSYEVWLRTGSRRAREHLRRAGIQPSEFNVSRSRH